uniref:NAD-dependent epimerase/dehydratase family protein n=1 Tax=Fundidesulfovibrio putealis TaxID=270496 RepID=A0A7C3WCI0_9BACT
MSALARRFPRRPPSNATHTLVTGGAGFIGSHLVERLLAEGRRVVVLDDLSSGSLDNLAAVRTHPGLRLFPERITACRALENLVRNAETIYHLAAVVGVERVTLAPVETLLSNLRETETVLTLAARHVRPTLLASSSEVYGRSRKRAFAEDDDLVIGPPHLARWSYACSKLADEFLALALAREQGFPVVVARLFNVTGPRQSGRYGMVLPRFVRAALAGLPLEVHGSGSQTRAFCWVGDAVEALLRLMQRPEARGQVFNVGQPRTVSILELARRVVRVTHSASAIRKVPYTLGAAEGFEDMRHRRPVVTRLWRVTGYRPSTPLDEIIRRTAASLGGPSGHSTSRRHQS